MCIRDSSKYVQVCGTTGLQLQRTADWTQSILPFWPAVIRSALSPLVLIQLLLFTSWATIKGAVTAVLMMQGFDMDLLVFGAFCATKCPAGSVSESIASGSQSQGQAAAATQAKDDSAGIYLYGHNPKKTFLSALYRFSYPHTWVGTTLSVSVVSFLAFREAALVTDSAAILPAALHAWGTALVSALCINVYIVGINQIFDVEIDKVNKPYLPLASGEWSIAFASQLCVSLLAVGLGIGYTYGTVPLQYTLAGSAALGTAYSTDIPLLRWKKYPLLASGCILVVRAVIVQVGFFSHIMEMLPANVRVDWTESSSIVFSMYFILAFSIVIAFFKDLPDVPGDIAGGVDTLAVRVGAPLIFNGCVAALVMDYAGALLFCTIHNNYVAVAAHLVSVAMLVTSAQTVDLESEVSIKQFYMLIWKLFYAEYLILLLL
eukprot:TRINITY_DN4340_c0_g1_i2.p1 TRINITY_DN4340_c0_g1~~TRINITY_DN4340_c0_g1_i2.p1  ORF type:complete len:432 (-),score=141.14 TRINITY_DN4340_c0_g1_i2:82-1377(-)